MTNQASLRTVTVIYKCMILSNYCIVDTVVVLIFYHICKSKGKLISLKDLKKAQFGQILNELENEPEINNVNEIFIISLTSRFHCFPIKIFM
jgi:hypothetical protein